MWWFYKNNRSSYPFFAANVSEAELKTVNPSLLAVRNKNPVPMSDLELWNKEDKPHLSVLIPMEFLE